jgi:hypothetical protein
MSTLNYIIETVREALQALVVFVSTAAATVKFASKRAKLMLRTTLLIDADGIYDKRDNVVGIKNLRVSKVSLSFEKAKNLVTNAFLAGTFVALCEPLTDLLKGISNDGRDIGIRALKAALDFIEKSYGLTLVANRYIDGFNYDDGIKRATLLFHKNGPKGFGEDLSMALFGAPLLIKGNDTVKFMNYVWAGTQTRFSIMTVNYLFTANHKGGTDGSGWTTLEYLNARFPELAKEVVDTNTHLIKQQAFASILGHVSPIKGCIAIAYNRTEWHTFGTGVAYDKAIDAFVVTDNEVKLAAAGIEIGHVYEGRFGVINMSGEETLRKPFWKANPQLLARTNWKDCTRGTAIAKANADKILAAITTKDTYLKQVLHLSGNDVQDPKWQASRMSAMTIAGQLVAGLPFSAFESSKSTSENIAMREIKKALKGMICSIARLKIPGSYFYPLVDDRLVGRWEVGMSPWLAEELGKRWNVGRDIHDGDTLMVQRSPHIGSGYLAVTIKIIDPLCKFDGIVLSRWTANLLAADCDGDRVSLSLPMIGDVINPEEFPEEKDASEFMKKMKLMSTGNAVADKLLAATVGKLIGLVDFLMSMLHEREGRLSKKVLAFGGHVSQALINSGKHVGEDVLDMDAISDMINPLQTIVDKYGKEKQFRKTISYFYRYITGKLDDIDYEDFVEPKGNSPVLNEAYTTTPLKGVYDALSSTGVKPFWFNYDWSADKAEWLKIVRNAQSILSTLDPDGDFYVNGNQDKTMWEGSKVFVDPAFFTNKSHLPVLHAAIKLLGKTAANAEEARALLRKHFDDKLMILKDEYPRYLVAFWARVFASGTPERALMMCLNTAEFTLVIRAIKNWTPEDGFNWQELASWSIRHMSYVKQTIKEVDSEADEANEETI